MAAKYTRPSQKISATGTGGLKQVKKQLETLVRGASFTPGARPPTVIAQPWNPLVAIDVGTLLSKTISAKDLAQTICDQVGFFYSSGQTDVRLDIEFRVLRVSAWSRDENLSLYPLDFVNDKNIELSRIDGALAKNQWARVGYTYPASLQAYTLSSAFLSDLKKSRLYSIVTQKASHVEIHTKILWRSAISKAPSLRWIMFPVEKHRAKIKGEKDVRCEEDEPESFIHGLSPPISSCSEIEDLRDEVKALSEKFSRLQANRV